MNQPIQRQAFGLKILNAKHPAVRKIKAQGFQAEIHGNKFWNSSFLIMDYLHKHPPEAADNVLDAGCGWGITGIWCARKFGASVVSLDADPAVFPYLNAVAELNNVTTTPMVRRFEQLKKSQLASFDLLVAADVCFWDELVKPVGKLIDRAIDAGVGQIVIADPERPTFHEMAEKAISRHGGDLIHWSIKGKLKATGALLVINNQ